MRILHVIPSLNPRDGGPAEWLKRSTEIVDSLGHETSVVCLDPPDAPWLQGLPFQTFALGPASKPFSYSSRLAPFIRAKREEYDVAVMHSLWNYGSIGAWRGLRDGGVPYGSFTHGMLDPWFRREYPAKHVAKQILWVLVQGRVLRDAHAVLFTTDEERRLARGSFAGFGDYRERVVGCGAAAPDGDPETQVRAFRAALPALGKRPFLLFLGRIHPKKGCDLLVSAFAEVAAAHPGLDLVMAGPDQTGWTAELDGLATRLGLAGRIHWPGMLSGDVKWGALRAADAFVLPSHQENFGIAVAEAAACSTPVLLTDKVNIWREIEATGAGLVASDDAAGIGALLRRYVALSDGEKDAMRGAARRCFEDHFDVRSAAMSLLGVLRDATEARR